MRSSQSQRASAPASPHRPPPRRLPARTRALAPLLLAALPALVPATVAWPATAGRDPGALRHDLLRLLNERRAAAGAPPLRLSPALDRAAQQHVEAVASAGTLRGEGRREDTMEARLKQAGYDAHQWTENLMSGPDGAAQLLSAWSGDDGDGTFRRLLDPDYADLGIGLGSLDGAPLYSILFAVPQSAAFARETAGLRDLERVRAELLTRINAERRRSGRQPLSLDSRLDTAAQRHAEDMLSRSFFAHRAPDGRTVRERARGAGYPWSAVGENLAEGQDSVKEAVEAWMRSSGHRENILDRRYNETGVGLALGRDPRTGEYRILWVQTFGLAR